MTSSLQRSRLIPILGTFERHYLHSLGENTLGILEQAEVAANQHANVFLEKNFLDATSCTALELTSYNFEGSPLSNNYVYTFRYLVHAEGRPLSPHEISGHTKVPGLFLTVSLTPERVAVYFADESDHCMTEFEACRKMDRIVEHSA